MWIKMVVLRIVLVFIGLTIPCIESQFPFTFLPHGPFDPDTGLTTVQLIQSRGFSSETHQVITEDGYILSLFRIVNRRISVRFLKRPIVLWHGLMMWSNDFINNSPGGDVNSVIDDSSVGNNLGFELAKRGYDVWLGNTRGNYYSRNHTTFPIDSWDFWNFSLDEMIAYDLPASIKYIRRITKRNKIGWIGHSQGNSIMLGLLSTRQEYNRIIEPFVLLAPSYTGGMIILFQARLF
jgi:lysosomal acid lipase/cholesteryl ester hydrolase